MLIPELEIYHSRPAQPTRRVALGHMVLPVDPAPGFGGLLLGSVVAAHLGGIDDDYVADIHRLIREVGEGRRIVQPRLRHRFQIDRHGLARSTHRLLGDGDEMSFDFSSKGTELAQVLGAIYAVERLAPEHRLALMPVLQMASRWRGPIGAAFIAHLAGSHTLTLELMANPHGWALDVLGFDPDDASPSKRQITMAFRRGMRDVHPDHGADDAEAAKAMSDLAEARRILTTT